MFRQGDIGCYWYAVLSGTLDVYVSSSGKFEVVFRMFQHREPGNLTGHALYPSKRKLFQFVVNLVRDQDYDRNVPACVPVITILPIKLSKNANGTADGIEQVSCSSNIFLTSSDLPLDSSLLLLGH